jgi:hypothetical protein
VEVVGDEVEVDPVPNLGAAFPVVEVAYPGIDGRAWPVRMSSSVAASIG